MKVVAVIPAYNEETTIADIVKRASQYANCGVIVVDDGSIDHTGWAAERAGAEAVKLIRNHGAGSATRIGLDLALSRDADVIVTLDGDGQHNPDEIPKLVAPFRTGRSADVVVGSRFLREYKLPRYRKFGIDVITWLYNVGYKQKLSDGQSCFRAYSRQVIEACPITENGFGFSTEILVKARKAGFSIVEVPISCVYHEDWRRNSTLNPLWHGLSVVFKTIKWRLRT